MFEAFIEAIAMIGEDFYCKLRPWNNEAMMQYMLRRAHQFVIPGSY